MRIAMGTAAGLVVAFVCIWLIEAVGHSIFPLPAGIDPTDPGDQSRMMEAMPVAAKSVVLVAWFVAALVGGWVANRIAHRAAAGWVLALIIAGAGVATMVMIPHPAWMWAGGIILPLLGAAIAQWLSKTRL